MGSKLFEIALAGLFAAGAVLYVQLEESGPARQLSRQWLLEAGVADRAARLVGNSLAGSVAPEVSSATVLSQPHLGRWTVVGSLSTREAGGLPHQSYRAVIRRLCDDAADRACWQLEDLELDGQPAADAAASTPEAPDQSEPERSALLESAGKLAAATQPAAGAPAPPLVESPATEPSTMESVAMESAPIESTVAEPPRAEAEPAAAAPAEDEGGGQPLYTWADPAILIPIQHQLTAMGFKIGRIDGVLGPRTREAIKRYQAEHGLPVDGQASAALLRHMTDGRAPAAAGGTAQGAQDTAAPPPPATPLAAPGGVAPAAGPSELLRQIQERLLELGYAVGPPDGILGPRTREAISTYQWRSELTVDGLPSPALLAHLEEEVGG